jgi:hypothetical protein
MDNNTAIRLYMVIVVIDPGLSPQGPNMVARVDRRDFQDIVRAVKWINRDYERPFTEFDSKGLDGFLNLMR